MVTDTGKTPKRSARSLWLYVSEGVMIVAALGLIAFTTLQSQQAKDEPCHGTGQEHQLIAKDETLTPARLEIKKCDTIKVVNQDAKLDYELAFGVHEKHIAYPGYNSEHVLYPGELVVIHAVQAGEYHFHDHIRDKAEADIIISQ